MNNRSALAGLLLLAALPARAQSIDLLHRYPTTLTAGDASPNHARPWAFTAADTDLGQAQYVAAFEGGSVRTAPAISRELAAAAFDQLWSAFDRDYAMFVLRPEVDWDKLRERYRPQALAAKSAYDFAGVCAQMLRPLRDLHVWLTVAGANVPVFNRPRFANANPQAAPALLGELHRAGRRVQWTVTPDKIGYLAIYSWSDRAEPRQCDQALETLRDTRGLIICRMGRRWMAAAFSRK